MIISDMCLQDPDNLVPDMLVITGNTLIYFGGKKPESLAIEEFYRVYLLNSTLSCKPATEINS
jgi:hypothetical protein